MKEAEKQQENGGGHRLAFLAPGVSLSAWGQRQWGAGDVPGKGRAE